MVFSWFLLVGMVLILMAFASRWVSRLPLSFAVIYLAAGFAIGPQGVALLHVDLVRDAPRVQVLAEVAVLISLFALGLRLRLPLAWKMWRTPVKLATLTMALTIAGVALLAHSLLALPWPVAVLLGAVLAPTDPVLASDVQVRHPGDRDALRVALTAEAGLNDGTAFPAVLLGLLLVADAPDFAGWLLRDIFWGIGAGIVLGAACGTLMAKAVDRLRRSGVPLEFEEFLAFGVIAVTYGTALALDAYGFIAVFAAGLAFAHAERRAAAPPDARGSSRNAGRAETEAEAETANRLLTFSTQCERLAEVGLVLLIGAALGAVTWRVPVLVLAAAVILLVRPIAVVLTIRRDELSLPRRRVLAWFGIRGIGSIYYAAYALGHAPGAAWLQDLASATVATVAVSIGAHGISATPLMRRVPGGRRREADRRPR